jgi:cytochrome c oxidase assembly factor CtaG
MKTVALWLLVIVAGVLLGQGYVWLRVRIRRRKNG